MTALFVYGTLRHRPLLDRLLGWSPTPVAATLTGWRAARLRDLPYPGLVPAPGRTATGALVEVGSPDLEILDRFEGPMYERITVSVSAGGETVPDAHVWRLRDRHHDLVLAGDWDLREFVATDAGWFAGDREDRP